MVEQARARGIRNLLALRGDPPGGTGEFKRTEGGFEYSHELVAFLRELGGFSLGTAGFPEGHIACKEGKYDQFDSVITCQQDAKNDNLVRVIQAAGRSMVNTYMDDYKPKECKY